MSCGPCDEKKREQKGMTRGAFLGTGAAAAAAAAVGAVGAAEAEEQTGCGRPPKCGPRATLEWEIEASVLQVIWGDIFPRFVAYKWETGAYPAPLPISSGPVSPQDLIQAIYQYIHDLPMTERTSVCSAIPVNCDLTVPDLTPFERRAKFVIGALEASGATPIPIRLLGDGGFDFILSDAGLDLFAPPEPVNVAELLRYYQYRNSGRSTIGIPGYLDDAGALAFDVQSPVGPSQVWIDHLGFFNTPVSITGSCTLDDLKCLDVEDRDSDEQERDPETGPLPGWKQRAVKKFTIEGFFAAAAQVRCWQLEGSVYRGIIEQLPRVVATVWREISAGCALGAGDYASRFHHPTKMRDIFEERLESTLPRPSQMVFRTPAPSAQTLMDVMISNRGIMFPRADTVPNLSQMFTAIKEGRAGNPVFTDSRRPPRKI